MKDGKALQGSFPDLVEMILGGMDKRTIMSVLNLEDDSEFDQLYDDALCEYSENIKSKAPERSYAEFVIDSRSTVRQLREIAQDANPREQIAALKASFDISKEIFKQGRDLGFIQSELATDKGAEMTISIRAMSNEQLRDAAQAAFADLKAISSVDFIDVKPQSPYEGDSIYDLEAAEQEEKD